MAEGFPARRALYAFSWLAPAWALVAMATGGVAWAGGSLRLSSHDPLRPILIGLVAAAFYAWGALTIWLRYLLGRDTTSSRAAGAGAAVVLLSAPVFLAHLMLPMTDVPVAAGWTLVLLLTRHEPHPYPLAAGLVAGLTLLIRPNLLLLSAAPVIAWMMRDVRRGLMRGLWFGVGLAPAAVSVAALNTYLYGSPFISGYGSLGDMYGWAAAPVNLRNYFQWLFESQSGLIVLAAIPLAARSALRTNESGSSARAGFAALGLLTLVSYLFYGPFDSMARSTSGFISGSCCQPCRFLPC